MSNMEINRRSLLKRSAGVMALAMGGGTPFLSSRAAYAQAADLAVKLAQRKPVVARGETDNGKMKVPSVLLDIVAVTKDNMRETVVKDGFRKEADIYQGVP